MKVLHLDCASGISGDMMLGALLDLGADEQALREGLASLDLADEFALVVGKRASYGITGTDVDVRLLPLSDAVKHQKAHAEGLAHDHAHAHGDGHCSASEHDHMHGDAHDDMHGHTHGHVYDHLRCDAHDDDHVHTHGHMHDDDHVHTHGHVHDDDHDHLHDHAQHGAHDHAHHHDSVGLRRNLSGITKRIAHSGLSDAVKARAIAVFTALARAEAKVHGADIDQVHFHEVGAVDAMVDIIGSCILLDNLDVARVTCTPIAVGSGTVRCEHGVLTVPAPAVLELLRGVPITAGSARGELATPTGAALAQNFADSFSGMPDMTPVAVGYGLGKRDTGQPNVLRAVLGEVQDRPRQEQIAVLEANIDDMTSEELGYLMARVFEAGALDVWYTPIQMKKNRPAVQLSAACALEKARAVEEEILFASSTLGVRRMCFARTCLARKVVRVETPYGAVRVKGARTARGWKWAGEYEDCAALAAQAGAPLRSVLAAAHAAGEAVNWENTND
nr:nickel pincer cofactor biosynthesis protein LarC [Maliibacterium massiliense]